MKALCVMFANSSLYLVYDGSVLTVPTTISALSAIIVISTVLDTAFTESQLQAVKGKKIPMFFNNFSMPVLQKS